MKNRWSQIISETLGAAAGTTLATLAFGDSATDVAVPCTDPVHMQLHKGIVLVPHTPHADDGGPGCRDILQARFERLFADLSVNSRINSVTRCGAMVGI